ncbi:hypothetical protein F4604DRAFT_1919270 [Suillus subluteus]|nr:hypothetical protein F4604DRAFT_1919270 [Suillus subluteus]
MSSFLSRLFEILKTAIMFTPRMSEVIHPEMQSHVQYHGYAVSEEWLHWFWNKLNLGDHNDIDVKSKEYFEGLVYLADIDNLGWKCCFNPKCGSVDDEEPKDTPINTIQVLYMFQKPLHEKKIEAMTALLGRGPEWWAGCSD